MMYKGVPIQQDHDQQVFAEASVHDEPEFWKVMLVDDDAEVHTIIKDALSNFIYLGKKLQIISAYSGYEAQQLICKHPDTAVILLDVVMEEEDSGLKVAHYIRRVEQNNLVRIVLKTDMISQVPDLKVILDYDINDYRERAELTTKKLFTAIFSSIRSYHDLIAIDANKRVLEQIVKASVEILEVRTRQEFVFTVFGQVINLLSKRRHCSNYDGFVVSKIENDYTIQASTGCYNGSVNKSLIEIADDKLLKIIFKAFHEKRNLYTKECLVLYFNSKFGVENCLYLSGMKELGVWKQKLIDMFCTNVAIILENKYLSREIEDTQKEIIFTLGEVAERRSKETGYHVKRVAEYSRLLAIKYGLKDKECEIIRVASSMHDVGKLAIPDNILHKPGKLTEEEFETMKMHADVGYQMLKNSHRDIMQSAAIIAAQHHEKYNGLGYPQGIKGKKIHLYGRIAAIADVFDALGTKRVYKKAWTIEQILDFFEQEKGQHFDPQLVDILFANIDEFLKIREKFADPI